MEALRKALTDLADQRGIDMAALAARARELPPRADRVDPVSFRRDRNERLFDLPGRLPQKPEIRQASLDHPDADPRVVRWRDMRLANPGAHPHLLMSGSTGTGKTHHSVALLKDLVQRAADHGESPSWRYVSHVQLARKMRDFRDDNARRTLDELLDTRILVLDDLGTAVQRDYGLEWLIELVDSRYVAGPQFVTIYATNLRPAELVGSSTPAGNSSALDSRIASRLLEGNNVIIMDGADRRRATTGVIR